MKIKDTLDGRKILIWGMGREGKSTERFIRSHVSFGMLKTFEGKAEEIDWTKWDYVIKSPGIPYLEKKPNLTSQTSLFLSEFAGMTAGITGTKGKSTTTDMLYHILRNAGKDAVLVGNIGIPCLDLYDEMEDGKEAVFEMSCHQLNTTRFSPHIAVILNIYEEHLDYYGTMEKYTDAKMNILRYQKSTDFYIAGSGVAVPFVPSGTRIEVFDSKKYDLKIVGRQFQYNAAVADTIAEKLFSVSSRTAEESLHGFEGLRHRLENIGTFGGVTYYDDSISTIGESAVLASESVPDIGSLIIGGMDRGIDYSGLTEYIDSHPSLNVICMYATGKRVYDGLKKRDNIYLCGNLAEAVECAVRVTPQGKACVMSPAAASYDSFRNFEDRGDCFRKLVSEHK